MSETSQPIQVLDVFNKQNFHTGLASEFVKFPKAQSTVTMPNGVKFGDGTFQNSASTGSSLTVQEVSGTNPLIVTEVDTIKVSNSTLVDNQDGSVTITTGGGGGGGSLTVQDNVTTASSVSTITLPNNTLTNHGGGSVTIKSPTLSQVMTEGATASANLNMATFDIINLPGLTFASSNYVLTCSKFTTVSNNNIVFNPGSSHVEIDATGDSLLRLRSSSNAYVGLQAPPGSFTTHDIVLPTSSGTSGQLLQSNGSGNALTWVTQSDPNLDAVLTAGNTTTQNLTAAVITASTNFSGPLSGDVTGDLTGDVTGEIKTSTNTRGATLTTTSTTSDTLTLNTAGFTYETFDYTNSSTAAVTITTLSLTGTQRNNSQYVVSIDNTGAGTGTFSFSTTFTGAKINYTTQVDIPNGEFGILTIYYKDSSTIFASASVFS